MRNIGTIPRDVDAERFSDYLLAQGMPNMVEESSGGSEWLVWVENDDDLDRARAELGAFRADPGNQRFNGVAKVARTIRSEQEKKQQRLRKRFIDVRTSWAGAANYAFPLTMVLIAASVVIAIATGFGRQRQSPIIEWLSFAQIHHVEVDGEAYYTFSATEDLKHGQVWRLITPIFLHFGPLHLLFNMWWLADLGRQIELRRGTLRLAALVLGCALLSNVAEYAWSGPLFGGMSGVVYALFGYVWMKGRFEPHLQMGVMPQTVTIMLVWLVACMTGLLGPIANAAHVAGLAAGLVAGYAPTGWRRLRRIMRS